MCSTVLPCPLCCQPNFPTVDSLRISLVSVTSRPLVCPICSQLQMGLDKLTIHLFSHSLPFEPVHKLLSPQFRPHVLNNGVGLNVFVQEPSEHCRIKDVGDKRSPKCANRNIRQTADVNSQNVSLIRQAPTQCAFQRPADGANQLLHQRQVQQQPIQQQPHQHQNHEQPVKVEVFEMLPDRITNHSSSSFASANDVSEPMCIICGFSFRNQELHQMHMQLVHEIHVNDDTPDEKFASFGGVTDGEYADDAHGPRNGAASDGQPAKSRFQCHLCPKHFKMKGSLRVHLRVMHTVGGMAAAANPIKPVESDVQPQTKPEDDCSSSSSTAMMMGVQSHLYRTADNRTGEVEDVLLATMMASPMPSPVTSVHSGGGAGGRGPTAMMANGNDSKLWECDICAKSFTTKYFLKKHKRLHTGEMPYTCDLCSKTFTFQQSYHKHLLYHNDDKPHVCSTCGRAFKELSTLHNHERIHSGEKPFKCETCQKCFRQRVSYLVHRRIHTGVMPYKCTACDKSFRYKVSQRTHKCPAQPPGEVIRQTGDLLQRLIQSAVFSQTVDSPAGVMHVDDQTSTPSDIQMGGVTPQEESSPTRNESKSADDVHQPFSNQSLDELLAEHCDKIGIGNSCDMAPYERTSRLDTQIQSPSDQFQHMCLYAAPSLDDAYSGSIGTIDDSALNQYLFGNE